MDNMQTVQTQIKLNLPLPLKALLSTKAERVGIPMSSYIRHLIIQDVEDLTIPVYAASKATERMYRKALEEKDLARKVSGDIATFLDTA